MKTERLVNDPIHIYDTSTGNTYDSCVCASVCRSGSLVVPVVVAEAVTLCETTQVNAMS